MRRLVAALRANSTRPYRTGTLFSLLPSNPIGESIKFLRRHPARMIFRLAVLLFCGSFLFTVSVIFFPLLALIAALSLIATPVLQWKGLLPRRSWLRCLCASWLVLAVPTFGVMPLLIATRIHFRSSFLSSLAIFEGFTLSYVYDLFKPTPELFVWDHPFPPVSDLQLGILGVLTLCCSIAPVLFLLEISVARTRDRRGLTRRT